MDDAYHLTQHVFSGRFQVPEQLFAGHLLTFASISGVALLRITMAIVIAVPGETIRLQLSSARRLL
jgi:hypothetical protein